MSLLRLKKSAILLLGLLTGLGAATTIVVTTAGLGKGGCGPVPAGGVLFPCETSECLQSRIWWVECIQAEKGKAEKVDPWTVVIDELLSRAALGGEELRRATNACHSNKMSACEPEELERLGRTVLTGDEKGE